MRRSLSEGTVYKRCGHKNNKRICKHADVPLHFTAFHPDYKMSDIQATPASTLVKASDIAFKVGLNHVYTGNVHNHEGDTTFCPKCHANLIERDWYQINQFNLDKAACCPDCGTVIVGKFEDKADNFGSRRIPVRINQIE